MIDRSYKHGVHVVPHQAVLDYIHPVFAIACRDAVRFFGIRLIQSLKNHLKPLNGTTLRKRAGQHMIPEFRMQTAETDTHCRPNIRVEIDKVSLILEFWKGIK
jgi:hypothetical protein